MKKMFRLTLTFGVAFAVLVTCYSADAQSSKVAVVGFSVAKKKEDDKWGQTNIPGMYEGVRVYLKVPVGKDILSIDDKSVPAIFAGETDLSGKKSRHSNTMKYMIAYSKDRKTAVVPIQSSLIPPAGTKSLSVKGSLKFNCGTSTKDETIEIELKTGSNCKMAGVDAEIKRISKGYGSGDSTAITFTAKASFDHIKMAYSIDGDGKEHEGRKSGSSSYGSPGKLTATQSFQFPNKQDDIKKIKIVYYDDVESVEVPVELSFGLGL